MSERGLEEVLEHIRVEFMKMRKETRPEDEKLEDLFERAVKSLAGEPSGRRS